MMHKQWNPDNMAKSYIHMEETCNIAFEIRVISDPELSIYTAAPLKPSDFSLLLALSTLLAFTCFSNCSCNICSVLQWRRHFKLSWRSQTTWLIAVKCKDFPDWPLEYTVYDSIHPISTVNEPGIMPLSVLPLHMKTEHPKMNAVSCHASENVSAFQHKRALRTRMQRQAGFDGLDNKARKETYGYHLNEQ